MKKLLLVAPIALLIGSAAYLLISATTLTPAQAYPKPVSEARGATENVPLVADPGLTGQKSEDSKDSASQVEFPDGTTLPALNGVRRAAKMQWNAATPYAPVVGKESVNGQEFYVHADGSRSSTIRSWRKDLGRWDSVTLVYNPTKAQPRVDVTGPDPGQKGKGKRKTGPGKRGRGKTPAGGKGKTPSGVNVNAKGSTKR